MKTIARHLFVLLLLCLPALTQSTRQPNVIFILVDDMGYADLSSYGSKDIRTPHIDRLAKEGVKLTQMYSNAPYVRRRAPPSSPDAISNGSDWNGRSTRMRKNPACLSKKFRLRGC